MKHNVLKVITGVVFAGMVLFGMLPATASTAYATNVSGAYYASNFVENDDLVLIGNTTLYVNADLTLNSISGDYNLDIQWDGEHTLTINNPNGNAIDVAAFTCTAPLNLTATQCAIMADSIEMGNTVTAQGGGGYYTIYAENDFVFNGKKLDLKGSAGVCSAKGNVTIDANNVTIMGQDGVGIFSCTGNVDIESDYIYVQCSAMDKDVTRNQGICAQKDLAIASKDATIVGVNAVASVEGNITMTGDFSVGASEAAILASAGSITMNGSVTAQGGDGFYVIYAEKDITFEGEMLDVKGSCGICNTNGNVSIDGTNVSIVGQDGAGIMSYVGSVDVDSDYFYVQCIGQSGNAIRDYGIGALKNISIVSKNSTISGNYGIKSDEGTISLTGTFWVGAEKNAIYAALGNIVVNGTLTANNVNKDYSCIVSDEGDIVIMGGGLYAKSAGTYALCANNGNIQMDSNLFIIVPESGRVDSHTIVDANGSPVNNVNIVPSITEDISIWLNSPAAGERPVFSGKEIYGLNNKCTVKSVGWYENNAEFNGTTFVAGRNYKVEIILTANTGYVFKENLAAKINTISSETTLNNERNELTIVCDLGECPNVIKNVDLNITAPSDGESISYNVTDESDAYSGTANSDYFNWYVSDDGINYNLMSSGDKFVGGKYYKVEIEVKALTGYEFAIKDVGTIQPDVYATINGHKADVVKTYDQDPSENITVKYCFGVCNDTIIEEIDIINVQAPVPGKKPVYVANVSGTGYSISSTDSSNEVYENGGYVDKYYIRNGIGWYDITADNWIYETDTFIPGHDYQATIYLITDDGYTFACNQYYEPLVTAHVNSIEAEVLNEGSLALNSQKVAYTFIYEVQEVSDVEVSGIDVPVGNLTPDYTGVLGNPGLYEFDKYGYDFSGFWWYDSQDNTLTEEDKFVLGETYTLEIKLVPKMDGQRVLTEFVSPVTAILNGETVDSADVFANETTVYIYYTYTCDTEFGIEITEAEVTVTEPIVGKNPSYDIDFSAGGDKYTATINCWFVNDGSGEFVGANKTFEKEVSYGVMVTFIPKTGYKFTDQTVFTINGKTVTTWGYAGQELIVFPHLKDGLCEGNDGKWYYYTNNEVNTGYTGMAQNETGLWYVKNGVMDTTFTGMIVYKGKCIYVNKGKYDTTFTGIAKNSAGIWYINKGNLDLTYTGMAKNAYGLWYMKDGKLDTTFTGMTVYSGKCIYVNKGKYDTTYTGIVKNSAGLWYFNKGNLDLTYTGMAEHSSGVWYMKNGKLDTTFTGMIVYKGKCIYVNKGKYDTTYTGLAKNSAGFWYINKGNFDNTYTGFVKNSAGYWYIQKGKLDMTFSGKVIVNGKTFTVKNGKLV